MMMSRIVHLGWPFCHIAPIYFLPRILHEPFFFYFSYSDGSGANFCGNNTLAGFIENSTLFLNNTYQFAGQYSVTVTMENPFSTQTFSKLVSVSNRDCASPALSIGE